MEGPPHRIRPTPGAVRAELVRYLQAPQIVKSALRVFTPVLVWTAACAPGIRPVKGPQAHTQQTAPAAAAFENFARAPLAFEPDDRTPDGYVSRTPAYTLRVAPTWAEIQPVTPRAAQASRVRMHLLGANAHPTHAVDAPLPGTVNYVRGNDPAQWRTGVATYARVRYGAVYPGIDLVYYGSPREIEYDFVVAPGARVDRIALGFDGTAKPAINAQGDLELTQAPPAKGPGREPLVFRAPRAYQTIGGRQQTVDARYHLDGDTVGVTVGDYDRTQPLVIDPILSYSIALGGSDQDEGNAVAVDAAGNVYVAGFTHSTNYPASGSNAGAFDLFLTKLNPTGTVVLSSSFIGGNANDEMRGLAIDTSGNAYLTGVTRSTNFPTVNALQNSLKGESDAFVVKIATVGGGIQFSTYLGGDNLDEGTGIAVDTNRNVYVTGLTRSENFPTASAIRGTFAGNTDAFVTKLNPTGGGPVYSTYLGGGRSDNAHGIAVDGAGNATVVGTTSSLDFPVQNSFSGALTGAFDAFVTRLGPGGNLAWSTYLGGTDVDAAQGVTIDSTGGSLVTGSTASPDFQIVNGAQPTIGGSLDAFVARFPGNGGPPTFSTFLGGSGSDRGRAIARDTADRIYVVGQTFSANFPVVNPVQPTIGGNRDTFIAMLAPPYTAITYSTYLGGSNNDDGLGIAADALGRAYVTGATLFAWPDLAGESDAFVLRVSSGAAGVDTDGDGMPNDWETQFANDLLPNEDPDGDGLTNLQEYQAGTHPLGFFTRYLAEGATGVFFDTQLALFNPGSTTAIVLMRFQQEGAAEITRLLTLPPHSRQTILVDTVPGLENSSFSTVMEADAEVTLDRTMTWDTTGFGSSAETAAPEPAKTWYLAEGATHGRFDLYYLLQNPNTATANVTVRYLRPDGLTPIEKTYTVGGRSRFTINVDNERFSGVQSLIATDVSAKITSDIPILAERAMYQTVSGRLFSAGHESMGVTAPSTSWFFAEGATGTYFDLYLLLANPTSTDATVTIDYLFAGGGVLTKTVSVAHDSRRTLGVDGEDPQLQDAAFSMRIHSTVPIIAERAMWWPSPNWYEAHNSAGTVVTSPRWAVAEGEVGGTRKIDTFVLIANTSSFDAHVRVSVFYEDQGITEPKLFDIPANSRFNINVRNDFPESVGRRFSVLVEGQGSTPPELVVERAMYSDSGTTVWAAGTNALGTPLFPADTFIITEGGTFPRRMVVTEGTRVRFINRDVITRHMNSDPHPTHEDCPEIGQVDAIAPGQSKLTGNMVIDAGRVVCGFHDHEDPSNESIRGTIIIRP